MRPRRESARAGFFTGRDADCALKLSGPGDAWWLVLWDQVLRSSTTAGPWKATEAPLTR